MNSFTLKAKSLLSRIVKAKGNSLKAPWAVNILLHGTSRGNAIQVQDAGASRDLGKLTISIRGNGNRVRIGSGLRILRKMSIKIMGDDNEVLIGNDVQIHEVAQIRVSKRCRNGAVRIGDRTTIWNADIMNLDDSSSITIGADCMLPREVSILNSDEHAILMDGKVVNHARNLIIGNRVWIGMNASIMKNAVIPDGCIIGRGAIVAGTFDECNAVLAGVPARVVKRGVEWSRESVNQAEARNK